MEIPKVETVSSVKFAAHLRCIYDVFAVHLRRICGA